MNPETGQIYRGEEEIAAARLRGEPLVPINEKSTYEQTEPSERTGRGVSFQQILNERRRQKKNRL